MANDYNTPLIDWFGEVPWQITSILTFRFSVVRPSSARKYLSRWLRYSHHPLKQALWTTERHSGTDRLHLHALICFRGSVNLDVLRNVWYERYGESKISPVRDPRKSTDYILWQ